MTLFEYKILAALLIFLTSIAAVFIPLKLRAHPHHHVLLELGDAFASGIFLGAALFHLLPDAIQEFTNLLQTNYPWAEVVSACGFLLLLFLERISEFSTNTLKLKNTLPYMLTLILVVHAFVEGAALGINTALATASILFFAIIAHKSSESFALAIVLQQGHIRLKIVLIIISLFSVMTPLGILMGAAMIEKLGSNAWMSAVFNAFAAGTFLYMSTLHHINHHKRMHESENLMEFAFLSFGLGLMAVVAWWA